MKRDPVSVSKFISLILRHHPEVIGITVDEHGWADTEELIRGVNSRVPMDRNLLEEIVSTDAKQRYSFNANHTKIRANQGHSIAVDVELSEQKPPELLYHGTGEKSVRSIEVQGLRPMGRLYVHLSSDPQTAARVGARHGRPAVFLVKAGQMHRNGSVFYRSVNGVWLTDHVPKEYLIRLHPDERWDCVRKQKGK
ncbi:MAG: RNA 2'-phosphotransferase [Solobacterium sp.]|nr:RNA 2'-phosphotransferase [Solobacterium sp.]